MLAQAGKDDYAEWVRNWVNKIEKADELGDTKAIFEGVNALAGKSANFQGGTKSTKNAQGGMIQSVEELGKV